MAALRPTKPSLARRLRAPVAGLLACLALAFPLLAAVSCRAGGENFAARSDYADAAELLGTFIEWQMETKELPALSIALVDDQEIVWARGSWYAPRR